MARSRLIAFPLVLLVAGVAFAQPPGTAPWAFDEILLKNKAKFQGLILTEGDDRIRFQTVRRQPGRPTVTLTDTFHRSEIQHVRRLAEKDRQVLRERLAELDSTGKSEQERMESLELVADSWLGKENAARRYDSDYFTLLSGASDEVTRRAAVRLEQIYTAFARVLPPKFEGRPTTVLLAPDSQQYHTLLGQAGLPALLNPAIFDPQGQRILCGSQLRELGTELQNARAEHRRQLDDIARYEASVRKLYRQSKPDLDRHLEAAARERRRVQATDRANDAKFNRATAKLFAVLYHEAFHAYVMTFVYRPLLPEAVAAGKGPGELPRWFNEGLAQVFETSVVEAGELRADHADRERLNRTRDLLRAREEGLVPLRDLLVAGRELFRAAHADQAAATDRAYLSCWGLAHYLTFGRRVLGTPGFEHYIESVNTTTDPRRAFQTLVGQDLDSFEKDWHKYLLRLQPDGTLVKEPK